MSYEDSFLQSLALTVFIESIVLWIMVTRIYKWEIPLKTILFTGIIASFATLPYVWFILPVFIPIHWMYIMVAESFAVIAETFILKEVLRINIIPAFITSLVCNMVSFGIGLLVNIF